MHYHAEVWIKENKDTNEQVSEIMELYYEESNRCGFWDWWQIGGRWTGIHDDYDPARDDRNTESCSICGGTGYRSDPLGVRTRREDPSYTCNGCEEFDSKTQKWEHGSYGKGRRLKWPTCFAEYEGDVIPVSELKDDFTCNTLIIDDEVLSYDEGFDGHVSKVLKEMGISHGYLVTVDYHS